MALGDDLVAIYAAKLGEVGDVGGRQRGANAATQKRSQRVRESDTRSARRC
jgi:hypothetical protein